ncbi:hypothetical protein Tco_1369549 [Tanacetum coccineum]
MSLNRRKLKRDIRPPKRYDGFVSVISKRNDNDQESSNDEIFKDESMNKEVSDVCDSMCQNRLEIGEFDANLEKNYASKEKRMNEERKNQKMLANFDRLVNEDKVNSYDNIVMPQVTMSDDNGRKAKTYVNMVKSNEMLVNNNLIFIAPKVTKDGMVKVLFNEEIVSKGCAKWKFTICGHFIGQNLSFYELRYRARRMWGKFGLKDVIVNASGVNLFKFNDEIRMNCIGMEKTKPNILPIWVIMINILMEAWSMEGRTDYAFLVEIKAKKEMKDVIKIEYIRKNDIVKGTKEIVVMYDWKPDICSHCNVFGHCLVHNMRKNVQNQNKNWQQRVHNGNGNRQEYRKRNVNNDGVNGANKDGGQKDKGTATHVNKGTSEMNKFEVLKEVNANEDSEVRTLKDRMLVDVYLNKKIQPTCSEASNWSKDMIKYFKDQWEIDRLKKQEDQGKNAEDVFDKEDGIAQKMIGSERKELWRDIMRAKRITSGWPWLLTSDFNVTLKNEEHFNRGSRISNNMQDFIDYVNEAEMEDLCNLILKFPDANALFLPYLVSDHTDKDDFLHTVATGWEIEVQGYKMNELKIAQKNLDNHPHNQDIKEKEVKDLKDYNEAANDAESFLFQKEKIEWIYKGDRNNQFFHKIIQSGRQANKIVSICNDAGNRLEGKLLEDQFVNHLKKFPGASNLTNEFLNFKGVFGTKLNNEEAIEMNEEVTDSEIKNALFDIGDNKAPGPDGYTSTFFKKAQKIIGNDGYDKKSGLGRCCIKIDIAKAYDTMERGNFLVVENLKFKFHIGYKELRLTHPCFADNLLVVCNGDVKSVKVIKSTMLEFSGISSLIPNMDKSTVFFGNVKNEERNKILVVFPFAVGKLPVNFFIPKTMVTYIDKILEGFLWCKGEIKRGKAKVAWKTVCSPKSQGGLGLRSFDTWNEVLLIRNLWNIVVGKNTLWVK